MWLKEFIMFKKCKCKDCNCNNNIVELMEKHSTQHKWEHYIVLFLLGIVITFDIVTHVI